MSIWNDDRQDGSEEQRREWMEEVKQEYRREREILSDYEDMPYQFDNMTGSMNL